MASAHVQVEVAIAVYGCFDSRSFDLHGKKVRYCHHIVDAE